MARTLNRRQTLFVLEYLVDLNATQAAIRAGYSEASAGSIGFELLKNPAIDAAIDDAMAARGERLHITADRVLEKLWDKIEADPTDLVQVHRCCCRYCWGADHRYQYTPAEFARCLELHAQQEVAASRNGSEPPPPLSPGGGVGYDPRKDPNPDCPECFGWGEERAVVADTRKLSSRTRALLASIKATKDGIEVKTHDQAKFFDMVGRHLGMFRDSLELSGKNGGPMQVEDARRAALLHALLMKISARGAQPTPPDDGSDLV